MQHERNSDYFRRLDATVIPNSQSVVPLVRSFSDHKVAVVPPAEGVMSHSSVAITAPAAGLGHERVATAVVNALKEEHPNGHGRVTYESTSSNVHSFGSNSIVGRWATEVMQRNKTLQDMFAWPIHATISRRDTIPVMNAVSGFVAQSPHTDIFHLAFHPDPAFILSQSGNRAYLDDRFRKKNYIFTVLTDHLHMRPQFPVYLLNTDVLIVPDEGSKRVAVEQLSVWAKRLRTKDYRGVKVPEVVVCPYPIDFHLLQELPPASYQYRRDQADPKKDVPMQIIIPAGGSFPQKEMILSMAHYLKRSPHRSDNPGIHLIAKRSAIMEQYFLQMQNKGVVVHAANGSTHAIDIYNHMFETVVPLVMVTKPSELHVNSYIPPTLTGGVITFYTRPVGDQEHQNIEYLRSEKLIPDTHETEQLTHVLLGSDTAQLGYFLKKAHTWRGICLPRDSYEASLFITNAKRTGIIQQMMNYRLPDTVKTERQLNGSTLIWQYVDAYKQSVTNR